MMMKKKSKKNLYFIGIFSIENSLEKVQKKTTTPRSLLTVK